MTRQELIKKAKELGRMKTLILVTHVVMERRNTWDVEKTLNYLAEQFGDEEWFNAWNEYLNDSFSMERVIPHTLWDILQHKSHI